MASLSDLAAARHALTIAQAGPGPKGVTLDDLKRALVFGEPLNNMNIPSILEDAVRRGCMDVDLLRTLADHKLDVMLPEVVEQERRAYTDRVVETAVERGWYAALGVLGDIWFDHNVHKIVLVQFDSWTVHTLEIDGVLHGTSPGYGSNTPTQLSLFPSEVAKRLLSIFSCTSEIPYMSGAARLDEIDDLSLGYDEKYFLKGYSVLHVSKEGAHYTPFKLPEYAVAKAASGLTDEQFSTLWDVFSDYWDYSSGTTQLYEDEDLDGYVGFLRLDEDEAFVDEALLMKINAWLTKIKPLCTALPITP